MNRYSNALRTTSFFLIFFTFFFFDVKVRAESLGFSFTAGDSSQGLRVNTIDELTGAPVGGATVTLSGPAIGDKQTATTDKQGNAVVKWPASSPVTLAVQNTGYANLTVIGVRAANAQIQLKALKSTLGTVLASGTIGTLTALSQFHADFNALNLGVMPDAAIKPESLLGNIKFGLVIHSISSFDLLNFDVSSFVSPLSDTINVQGSHNIPSNLVLPKQSLLFGTIKLNKPGYRLPVTKGKPLTLSGLQGSIGATDLGGGNFNLGIINKISLSKVSIQPLEVPSADFTEVVSGGYNLASQYSVSVTAPPFSADVLVAAAADISGDGSILVPTDAKLAAAAGTTPSGAINLMTAPSAPRAKDRVFAIAMSDNGRRLSGILNDAQPNLNFGSFLNADLGADAQPMPAAIVVTPPSQGMSALVFGDGSGAFEYLYIMPSAAQTSVNTAALLNGHTATNVSQVQLQFSTNIDESHFDGRTALQGLAKFTRVQTNFTP